MWKGSYTMPWKGLRFGGTANVDFKTHSETNLELPVRHSEHVPRRVPSIDQLPPRLSESIVHSPLAGDSYDTDLSTSAEDTIAFGRNTDHAARRQSTRRSRFRLMRFRHASDPQLSAAFNQAEPPPVPSLPPPRIIKTSPTFNTLAHPTKRKNKFKLPSHRSSEEHLATHTSDHSLIARSVHSSNGSPAAGSSLRTSRISFGEPGRLSTTSLRSTGARTHGDGSTPSAMLPGTRLSESSRSDLSAGEQGICQSTSANDATSATTSFFRFPRLKRTRSPLFPLPVKIAPVVPSDPHKGHSSECLPPKKGPPKPNTSVDHDHLSSLPSPSHSALALASPTVGSSRPLLSRKDSTTSARSGRSSPSLKVSSRKGHRGRSSTMGSLADIQDGMRQSSSDLAPSSRTSTYTTTRKSFGDLFTLPQRLRQNSEPPASGDRSPSVAAPTTPASVTSKSNSFSMVRELPSYPARQDDDTPATYLARLEGTVQRGAIAAILSKSPEDFFSTTLRKYMRGFSFFGDPMDMALRKLLMEVELPKETQQIDRVLQSFADRYYECNPGIFASTDQAYFIAFSLLILHTDVFNKNNKRKMQKQDYVRNTQGEGICDDILECFYDNILYTPFIHVEDEINLNGRFLAPKSRKPFFKVASSDHLSGGSKDPVGPCDPYALILDGKVGALRPNLKEVMELDDKYSCSGSGECPDADDLHNAFYRSSVLQIVSARSRPDAFLTQSTIENPAESHPGLVDIRVAKVGLLWRKDPKKKKARSPWQEWGALLTGSQLYFFKDVQWVKSLISQYEAYQKRGRRQSVTFKPPLTDFKPDAIISTDDAVALWDSSYKKHKHAFLFVRHGGFEEVFLANSETEMNTWVATINYAAAFRTAGVNMRGMIGADYESHRGRRTTRADSNASESSTLPTSTDPAPMTRRIDPGFAEEVFAARRELICKRIKEANEKLFVAQKQLDSLLRNARHLQILTPIHPRAREHVILAAGLMSAKLKWVRLDIWRTKCHREVLSLDLLGEEKLQSLTQNRDQRLLATGDKVSSGTLNPVKSDPKPSIVPASPKSDYSVVSPEPANLASISRTTSPDRPVQVTPSGPKQASIQGSLASSELSYTHEKTSTVVLKDDSSLASPSGPRAGSLLSEASIISSKGKAEASGSAAPHSNLETPAPSVVGDGEQRLLKEVVVSVLDGPPHTPKRPDMADGPEGQEGLQGPNSGEHRSKARRSLQRSLRDASHVPHHHRSKKGRDSATTISGTDDGLSISEGAGLARGTGSFTLHGKKASVITFGSEWQNMSQEQGLKMRKPSVAEDSRASLVVLNDGNESILSESATGKRTFSIRSASTATARSLRNQGGLPGANEARGVPEILTGTMHEDKAESVQESVNSSSLLPQAYKSDDREELEIELPSTNRNGLGDTTGAESQTSRGDGNLLAHSTTQGGISPVRPEQAVSA